MAVFTDFKEEELRACAAKGEWWQGELDEEGEPHISIPATLIRDLMFNGPLHPTGLKIYAAIVDDDLDLVFLTTDSADGFAPPLALPNCRLCQISMNEARLHALDLRFSHVNSVQAFGLRLTGDLNASDLTLRGGFVAQRARIGGGVFFRSVKPMERNETAWLDFTSARIEGFFDASGAHLSHPESIALDLQGAYVENGLFLRTQGGQRTVLKGMLQLHSAVLSRLELAGIEITAPATGPYQHRAIRAARAEIKSDCFLRADLPGEVTKSDQVVQPQIRGCVSFAGAKIGGELDLCGAGISMAGRDTEAPYVGARTLDLHGARVGEGIHCNPLRVPSGDPLTTQITGCVDMDGAEVKGDVRLDGAGLASIGDLPKKWTEEENSDRLGITLSLRQAKIDGTLDLTHFAGGPPKGAFDFRGGHADVLNDDAEEGWPVEKGMLALDGFTYRRLSNLRSDLGSDKLYERRLAWLEKQFKGHKPANHDFKPQPYVQLAKVLRDMGHDEAANRIAAAKRRFQARCNVDRWYNRFFLGLLGLIANYGYSPARAICSALAIFAFGIVFYNALDAFALLKREPGSLLWVYALDAAIPLVNLGQLDKGGIAPDLGFWTHVLTALELLYRLAGLIVFSILVLTVSGLLKRD